MQTIKNSDSDIELMLAKGLWIRSYHLRKYSASVFGKPDLIFNQLKIVIFVGLVVCEFGMNNMGKTE